jgi:hypothetical protein
MTEKPEPEHTIADEFRNLGLNLMSTMRAAWESPERRKLQQELEEGLTALAATIRMEANTFTESPAGQRIKTDFEDLQERVRTGEAETKAREEIIKAIRIINTEVKDTEPPSSQDESGK